MGAASLVLEDFLSAVSTLAPLKGRARALA
jgi:hypothetical protein